MPADPPAAEPELFPDLVARRISAPPPGLSRGAPPNSAVDIVSPRFWGALATPSLLLIHALSAFAPQCGD